MSDKYTGIWPVMLTPFEADSEIDWKSLERLIDWYVAAGVSGLFANCQSSEMFFLNDTESRKLTKFVVDYVDGRVPVVASGHTASAPSHQIEQLHAIADTGVDAVILISNRLALAGDDEGLALENLQRLTEALPGVDFGIYECPYPYKRLLTPKMVRWCAASDRYVFIKDTCCDIATIAERLKLVADSRLHIANANTQTLLASLRLGAHGYSGIMANFHPELYVWLHHNWQKQPEKAERLARYLTVASLAEQLDYPVCAKYFQAKLGNFTTTHSRVRDYHPFFRSLMPDCIDQMVALGNDIKQTLGL